MLVGGVGVEGASGIGGDCGAGGGCGVGGVGFFRPGVQTGGGGGTGCL